MALVPSGPQLSTKYVLTGPDGTRCAFNDTTDVDYVGAITEIAGLDSPEVRENGENLTGFDGGVHGDFFLGRRPITISGTIYNVVSNEDRNNKITKLKQAAAALREDATLEWTPEGGEASFVKVRLQQPIRISGGWVKDFQLALIAADPRIYSTKVESFTLPNAPEELVLSSTQEDPEGICSVFGYTYWTNTPAGKICRANTSGGELTEALISTLTSPRHICTDGTYLYWIENEKGISRALLNGTEVLKEWVKPSGTQISALAVTATNIYFVHFSAGSWTVGYCTKAGTGLLQWGVAPEVESAGKVSTITVTGSFLYYGCPQGIRRGDTTKAGSSSFELWFKFKQNIKGALIASDESHVYWCGFETMPIRRIDVTGANFFPNFWNSVKFVGTAVRSLSCGDNHLCRGASSAFKKGEIVVVATALMEPSIIINKGSYETFPVFVITEPGEWFAIETVNAEEGISFGNKAALMDTELYVTIDTLNKTVVGASGANYFGRVEFPLTEWWSLPPGESRIRIYKNLVLSGAKNTIEFRNAWI